MSPLKLLDGSENEKRYIILRDIKLQKYTESESIGTIRVVEMLVKKYMLTLTVEVDKMAVKSHLVVSEW